MSPFLLLARAVFESLGEATACAFPVSSEEVPLCADEDFDPAKVDDEGVPLSSLAARREVELSNGVLRNLVVDPVDPEEITDVGLLVDAPARDDGVLRDAEAEPTIRVEGVDFLSSEACST